MSLLSIDDLGFTYPSGTKALMGLTMRIHRGEVVAIVGPSGCGKSTLLSIIAGLETATAGSVTWEDSTSGQDPANFGLRIGLVFQKDTVLPWRTVERNVMFGLENLRMPRAERAQRVDDLLEMGDLQSFRRAYPRELSGGMRKRLALLMTMAVRPELLLLDEPFAALDEPTRIGLHADVLRMVYGLGSSVILVTHDLGEAISLADTIYVLTRGPGRVGSIHEVGFGHGRDVFGLRSLAEYNGLYRELWGVTWAGSRTATRNDAAASRAPLIDRR